MSIQQRCRFLYISTSWSNWKEPAAGHAPCKIVAEVLPPQAPSFSLKSSKVMAMVLIITQWWWWRCWWSSHSLWTSSSPAFKSQRAASSPSATFTANPSSLSDKQVSAKIYTFPDFWGPLHCLWTTVDMLIFFQVGGSNFVAHRSSKPLHNRPWRSTCVLLLLVVLLLLLRHYDHHIDQPVHTQPKQQQNRGSKLLPSICNQYIA